MCGFFASITQSKKGPLGGLKKKRPRHVTTDGFASGAHFPKKNNPTDIIEHLFHYFMPLISAEQMCCGKERGWTGQMLDGRFEKKMGHGVPFSLPGHVFGRRREVRHKPQPA